jgi:hypothetical protein
LNEGSQGTYPIHEIVTNNLRHKSVPIYGILTRKLNIDQLVCLPVFVTRDVMYLKTVKLLSQLPYTVTQ